MEPNRVLDSQYRNRRLINILLRAYSKYVPGGAAGFMARSPRVA